MYQSDTAVESLRRVFQEGVSARDITEPLLSFDLTADALEMKALMETHIYNVVGIREFGAVVGYVERTDLGKGTCGDYLKRFEAADVISETVPLSDVVLAMRDRPRLFVTLIGRVGGIVTRTDMQKPPVRMWLFGMITLIEMNFNRLIQHFCPGEGWTAFLSEGRVKKAQVLLEERARRNLPIDLLDCLQFSDKGQIVARNEALREATRFQSRRQVENVFKSLEKLRNNLAHSQDIVSNDWDTIVLLSEHLDSVLEGPSLLKDLPRRRR